VGELEPRFGPLSVSDIAAEEQGDGTREWCFSVRGLGHTVQAARFATHRDAEQAHKRFQRAIELLTLRSG
jgi:hypothetical protein